jgi:thiamine-phosphate pyrophosphorylase
MLVTDRHIAGGEDPLVLKVADAVAGGVNVVQLREKDLPHDAVVTLAMRLREAIAGRALLIVNRPAESALEARGDGVHLPEDAEPPHEWPAGLLIGRSVHSLAAARRAESDGADYVIFGPVFETESHAGAAPAGPGELREVAAAVRIPVIAIGGVTAERVPEVLAAGAAGVAVIRAILASDDAKAAAGTLRAAMSARAPA